jgi:hypothetical protein
MASGAYQYGISKILDGTIDLDTTALKVMLLSTEYTYNADHDGVDDLTTGSGEVSATNYTGGFNGAGRKSATVAISVDNTNNKVICTFTDLTWTSLGGAANDTVAGAALIREITNDAASIPIVFFDFTDVASNGGDFTLDFAAAGANGGNLQFAV